MKDTHPTNWIRSLEWTTKSISHLERDNNKFMNVVDLWLDIIIERFITEFAVNTMNLYTSSEQEFLKGPKGRYNRSLYT